MTRCLIVYASSHGQTRKIAEALAARLRERGLDVDLSNANEETPPAPDGYDIVGIGSRIHHGVHARSITRYVDQHLWSVLARHNFFFSVSLTASDKPYLRDPGSYISEFVLATAWRPDLSVALAGGLPYRRYNPIRRLMMKLHSSRRGHPTDTHRDFELTDWGQVTAFADRVATLAGERKPDRRFQAPRRHAPCN